MMSDTIRAIILGIVEGITEFLPVSSTGHMLLVKRFFGLGEGAFWDSFIVLIQLGAILAIVVLYFAKLWRGAAPGLWTTHHHGLSLRAAGGGRPPPGPRPSACALNSKAR